MTDSRTPGRWRMVTEVVAVRRPHPRLTGHVSAYVGVDQLMNPPVRRRMVARAAPAVVIDFDAAVRRTYGPDGTEQFSPLPSPVSGVLDAPADVELAGKHFGVALFLTPPGAFALLGVPMRELAGVHVPLACVVGDRPQDRLADRLASAPDWPARFDLLDRLLPVLLAAGPAPAPAVLRAWHTLEETAGRIRISELADGAGLSRRRLEALFREQIGVSPKTAARILRFHRAFRMITDETRDVGLAVVAARCGYADQAHLSREVRALSGDSPARPSQDVIQPTAVGPSPAG
ncbi:helix-turn-helix domain-containing protein [Streptomyces gamaensis]|uniref:Helix-turn-helix domain-containing protein n=1 Tax=Streptomyces gamaensis TaxID=1763542 RepID=A0ABW0Z6S1_9ACTN